MLKINTVEVTQNSCLLTIRNQGKDIQANMSAWGCRGKHGFDGKENNHSV